jgi:signal transduction histidine kinase
VWYRAIEGCSRAASADSRRAVILVFVSLAAFLAPQSLGAAGQPAILVFLPGGIRGPFYNDVFSAFQSTVDAKSHFPITAYPELLDLDQFKTQEIEESLSTHLRLKYQGKPIGVIVAVGTGPLEFVLRHRQDLWRGVPIVFSFVDERAIYGLKPADEITGTLMNLRFADMITVARAVVPGLKGVAIVGDRLEKQPVFGHFAEEIQSAVGDVEVNDLTGLPIDSVLAKVASLPDHTAILYTKLTSIGDVVNTAGHEAVALVAKVANRPIVVPSEAFFGSGAVGGFLLLPAVFGEEAGQIALRVLNGEPASSIPISTGNNIRPIFDWRQLHRWGVDQSRLPYGSEIRFRENTIWQRYSWQLIAAAMLFLLQTALLLRLLFESRRRRIAEAESRLHLSEVAHMNRNVVAGDMSASIAHELNQPLGAILAHVGTAKLILRSASPNLQEVQDIIADIARDDLRASEIIKRLRSFLTKTASEWRDVDLNDVVREVLKLLADQAESSRVRLNGVLAPGILQVYGDPVQLQQVVVNLMVNAMESMKIAAPELREIFVHTESKSRMAEVSVADRGPGIPPDSLSKIFEPFFTTKSHGMGIGLSIARTIVQAHGGHLGAANLTGGGAIFRFSMPMSRHNLE